MREPRDGLADGDHLAGFRRRRGDYAVRVGLEIGIAELVACEVERALGAYEAAFGLVLCRSLAVEVGNRREAARLERRIALEVGGRLVDIGGRGRELGFGAFDLQLEILRVEPRHHVAGVHAVADIDEARDDLAGDAKAEVGLVARPYDADEFAGGILAARTRRAAPAPGGRTWWRPLRSAPGTPRAAGAGRPLRDRQAVSFGSAWRLSFH